MSVRVLVLDFGNPDMFVRGLALMALRFADAAVKKKHLPDVLAEMNAPEAQVRFVAAGTLAELGPLAAEAVPALVAALVDEDDAVCERAAEALGKIGTNQAVEALHGALENPRPQVRCVAEAALKLIRER